MERRNPGGGSRPQIHLLDTDVKFSLEGKKHAQLIGSGQGIALPNHQCTGNGTPSGWHQGPSHFLSKHETSGEILISRRGSIVAIV